MEGWLTGFPADAYGSKEAIVSPMPIHYTALAMKQLVLSG
jgi:hypothetical protein